MTDITLLERGRPAVDAQGRPTVEFIDFDGNVLATIVGDTQADVSMGAVSMFDHITEPRDVKDYYIDSVVADGVEYWTIAHDFIKGSEHYHHGYVKTREEIEWAFAHLKHAAIHGWDSQRDYSNEPHE